MGALFVSGRWCPPDQIGMIQSAPAAFQQPALRPRCDDPSRGIRSHETSDKGSLVFTRPVFLSPVVPGWNEDPSAFPRAPHPAVTSNARRGEDQPRGHWLELHHRHRQPSFSAATHCRATSRRTPALRGAGVGVLVFAEFGQDPGLEERLHQRQHTLVGDPSAHPAHQGRVVDPIEARLDIGVEHPAVAVGAELVDLRDRVLRPPVGPEP